MPSGCSQLATAIFVAAVGLSTAASAAAAAAAGSWQPPTTTPAPALDLRGLAARDDSLRTCGYVSGISSRSLVCPASDECYANSISSIVGCCPTTSSACAMITACIARSQSNLYFTDSTQTLYCSDITNPECATYTYNTRPFSGFTLYGCAATKGVQVVSATYTSSSTTSSTTTTPSSTTTTSAPAATRTTSSSSSNSSKKRKKSSTGAIVGGVLGGLAAAALIGFAIFYFMRRSRQSKENMGSSGATRGSPDDMSPMQQERQPQPQPQQQQYDASAKQEAPLQPGFGYAVPAAAVAAAGVAGGAAAYEQNGQDGLYTYEQQPISPTTVSPGTRSPDLQQQQQQFPIDPYQAPPPAPGMGFQSGPIPATYEAEMAELPAEPTVRGTAGGTAELTTEKPHREPRELP